MSFIDDMQDIQDQASGYLLIAITIINFASRFIPKVLEFIVERVREAMDFIESLDGLEKKMKTAKPPPAGKPQPQLTLISLLADAKEKAKKEARERIVAEVGEEFAGSPSYVPEWVRRQIVEAVVGVEKAIRYGPKSIEEKEDEAVKAGVAKLETALEYHEHMKDLFGDR